MNNVLKFYPKQDTSAIKDLQDRIEAAIDDFAGKVSIAEVCGILCVIQRNVQIRDENE